MVIAAILAGGVGKRMGDIDKPKQFLEIGGKPILVHTTEQFVRHNRIDHVVVLCPEEWIEYTRQVFRSCPGLIDIPVISGGPERNDTIMNAIGYIEREFGLDQDTVIVTHDAVRPFVTGDILERGWQMARACGNAVCGVPAKDTVKIADAEGVVQQTPPRDRVWIVQTPQIFSGPLIRSAYEALGDCAPAGITDDAMVLEYSRKAPVHMFQGAYTNIKITTPDDLVTGEAILKKMGSSL